MKARTRGFTLLAVLLSAATVASTAHAAVRPAPKKLQGAGNIAPVVAEVTLRKTVTFTPEVQRALGQNCGDKYIAAGDYTEYDKVLEYPCSTGLPVATIDAAAESLRSDPQTLRLLRLRIADLDTRLYDLTGNNVQVFEFLRAIAKEQP